MKLSLIILGAILSVVLVLLMCQDLGQPPPAPPPRGDALLPGEVNDPAWPRPIITSVHDVTCKDTVECPSQAADCVTKTFTVQKDTTYFLTTIYFNGDTTTASCRACGTVYEGDKAIMHDLTACPTGGPWVNFKRLQPGITYTLSVCLRSCPNVTPPCKCGESATADAIVSMRRVFD